MILTTLWYVHINKVGDKTAMTSLHALLRGGLGGPTAAGVPQHGGSVASLKWTSWLAAEHCLKAESLQGTWFVRPSVIEGKWALSVVPKNARTPFPQGAGIYDSLGMAQAAAQRAEDMDELSSYTPGFGSDG